MEDNQITDNDKEDDKQDRIELVQRAVEGDKEAFTNLYMLTYSEVYHIVKVFIHNEDTAQDIVQETYYKSLRKIKQLKEPDKFPVWIKKIAVNTAKAHLRKVDWVLFSEADGEGGKSIAELQDERLEHILITGMFNTFFELIIHEMPLEEAEHYLKEMRDFYTAGWMKIMGQQVI